MRNHPWHIELEPWPFYSQLNDWSADGNDDNASYNCGPESVAMCVAYLTGVTLPASFIKDTLYGEDYVGDTTTNGNADFLSRYTGTPTEIFSCPTMENLLWTEWSYLKKGWPLIGLFYFDSPGVGGHFRAVIGQSEHYCITADPWTGERRVEGHREHWAWSQGVLIGLSAAGRRCNGCNFASSNGSNSTLPAKPIDC